MPKLPNTKKGFGPKYGEPHKYDPVTKIVETTLSELSIKLMLSGNPFGEIEYERPW